MAVDTAAKRFSIMGLGNPSVILTPPSGAVDTYTHTNMYNGIAKDAPVGGGGSGFSNLGLKSNRRYPRKI